MTLDGQAIATTSESVPAVQLDQLLPPTESVPTSGKDVAVAAECPLSARELEVLGWTLAGKTAWEVGAISGSRWARQPGQRNALGWRSFADPWRGRTGASPV